MHIATRFVLLCNDAEEEEEKEGVDREKAHAQHVEVDEHRAPGGSGGLAEGLRTGIHE